MSNRPQLGKPKGTTYNLLFVCTGNTCRSPMAEVITRDMLARRGWSHVAVRSAGINSPTGEPASRQALDVAREHGLDMTAHSARRVTPQLLDWADLVLGMGPSHMHALAELGAAGKSALVTSFIEGDDASRAVADPFGGDLAGYRETFAQLSVAVDALLDRLEPILAP